MARERRGAKTRRRCRLQCRQTTVRDAVRNDPMTDLSLDHNRPPAVPPGAGPGGAPAIAPRRTGRPRYQSPVFYLISLPIWLAVVIRAASDTGWFDDETARFGAGLLALFVVLLVSERFVSRYLPWNPPLYFGLQSALIVWLMLLLPEQDYYAMLFIPLSTHAVIVLGQREGYRWIGVMTLLMSAGLLTTQEWPKSIALALIYASALLFVAAYGTITRQAEEAREQSQALLADLQGAYRQLEVYAAQVQSLAVVEERNRLARNLHDSVTQALYGLTLSTEAASRHLTAGEIEETTTHLRDVRDTARQALGEMRSLIYELRPPALEQDGLAVALQTRLAAVATRSGLETSLTIDGDERLPAAVELELDRISQEALNNTLKHARASRVDIALRQNDGSVALEITDDGAGFDPGVVDGRGGMGLRGMAERTARLGGRLAIESRPGGGTRIRAEVPR
jgi:signal transduction histidine kinase